MQSGSLNLHFGFLNGSAFLREADTGIPSSLVTSILLSGILFSDSVSFLARIPPGVGWHYITWYVFPFKYQYDNVNPPFLSYLDLVRFILIHYAHTQLGIHPTGITSGLFHFRVQYLSMVSCLSILSFSATSSDYVFLFSFSNKALPKNCFTFKVQYLP